MKSTFSTNTKKLAEDHARLGKVFSNPKRVLILWALAGTEKTVSEIAEAIGASRPRTSQHLLLMKFSNILESYREKKYTYYRIIDNDLLKNYPILNNGSR